MTGEEMRLRAAELGPYDAILSDAAPLTTGNRLVDTARSANLLDCALFYADTMLKPGGNVAVKVFQGSDLGELLKRMRGVFATARSYKPEACRSASFETYVLGLGKRC
jgi:23S rRNA (uridine2552-2'-O)-methyltransferase